MGNPITSQSSPEAIAKLIANHFIPIKLHKSTISFQTDISFGGSLNPL